MGDFTVERSTFVDAPPSTVRRHIEDFRAWREWSPWEDVDPNLERTYSEPSGGVGATYAWSGNKKAGKGSMELTRVADDQVDVKLRFEKPFPAENDVTFELLGVDMGTRVTWRMKGRTSGLMGLFSKVVPMDKLVGKDFEKGLARLKGVAEVG